MPAVGRAFRLAVDFEEVVLQVEDPGFADAGGGVGAQLFLTVVVEGAVGDFDDAEDLLGSRVALERFRKFCSRNVGRFCETPHRRRLTQTAYNAATHFLKSP